MGRWLTAGSRTPATRTTPTPTHRGYSDKVQGLLEVSPFRRAGLAVFAELVGDAGSGPVVDIGCGPGYVTRHLRALGVDAFGIDISSQMVANARRDHPDIGFEIGTMTDLALADGSLAGVLAFWSIIHVPDAAPSRRRA